MNARHGRKITDIERKVKVKKRITKPTRLFDNVIPLVLTEEKDNDVDCIVNLNHISFSSDNMYPLCTYYPYELGKKISSLYLKYKDTVYSNVESLYQALKFHNKTPEEKEWREIIRKASTPGIARRYGNLCSNIDSNYDKKTIDILHYKTKVRCHINDENDYDSDGSIRRRLMKKALMIKFKHCAEFRDTLLSTGSAKLVEDRPSELKKGWIGSILEEIRSEQLLK